MTINAEQIKDIIKESGTAADIENMTATDLFADNGIDSLDIMTILLEVQEQTSVKIPDQDIDQLTSIQAIIDYIKSK